MRFQWLNDYQELEQHLTYLKWNLNKSKLELIRWVEGDLVNARLEKGSRASSLEEHIEKMEQEIELLEEQKKEMLLLVDTFEGVDNHIIKMKYIDGMSLEDIADEIGYSISYVRKRHTEIRKTLSFLDGYNERRKETNQRESEIDFYADELRRKKRHEV